MTQPTRKQLVLIAAATLIIIALIYAFLPGAERVEVATVTSAPLQVTVEEEGETHVQEHYLITAPVAAWLRRVTLDPGDAVSAGDLLVELESPRSAMLDPRTETEAEARVEVAEASLQQAEALAEQAIRERERVERLAKAGSATPQQLEQARAEEARAVAARQVARGELTAARAGLEGGSGAGRVTRRLTAPAEGRILAIHRRSAGHINPGEPILELGDTDLLEVRAEVLSRDAVRIRPGMRVFLDQWGGEEQLQATVTRVERQAREVVSALGVEERRVQVVASLDSPPEAWQNLGSGYRVLARFVIYDDEDALQIPTGALFRIEEGWAVYVVEDDRAAYREVEAGYQTGLMAQILEGLSEGEVVIVHPDAAIEDGVQVTTDW